MVEKEACIIRGWYIMKAFHDSCRTISKHSVRARAVSGDLCMYRVSTSDLSSPNHTYLLTLHKYCLGARVQNSFSAPFLDAHYRHALLRMLERRVNGVFPESQTLQQPCHCINAAALVCARAAFVLEQHTEVILNCKKNHVHII